MNTLRNNLERKPVIFLEHPVIGITSPEFQEFACEVIKAIGRATKKSFKVVAGGLVSASRYLDRKWTEAAEMDRRIQATVDKQYTHNFHYLRCLI